MENSEDVTEPVSPSGRYFNTTVLCAYVYGFLESETPIEFSQAKYLLEEVFLPLNPRFSSIMVLTLTVTSFFVMFIHDNCITNFHKHMVGER